MQCMFCIHRSHVIVTLVRHNKAQFDTNMSGSAQKYMAQHKNTKLPSWTQKCPAQHALVANATPKNGEMETKLYWYSNEFNVIMKC